MSLRKKILSSVINSTGKRQTGISTALADTDLDKRIAVEIEIEDVVTTEEDRDCSDVDLVDKTVNTRLKRANWNFKRITPFWAAYFTAFLLGAAANPVDDVPSGKKKHALTRSLSDDLPALTFGDVFEALAGAVARKFVGHKVESIKIDFQNRQKVTMQMVTVGRFETEDMTDFDVPDCEILPALKTQDCKILVNGVDVTNKIWSVSINLANNIPTGEDAFAFAGEDVEFLERGDQPAYSLSLQIVEDRNDTNYALAAARTKVPVVIQLGADAGEHTIYTFPNTLLELNSRWRQFIGQLNRSSVVIDATPMKDATLGAPLKCDGFLTQTTALLLDS